MLGGSGFFVSRYLKTVFAITGVQLAGGFRRRQECLHFCW